MNKVLCVGGHFHILRQAHSRLATIRNHCAIICLRVYMYIKRFTNWNFPITSMSSDSSNKTWFGIFTLASRKRLISPERWKQSGSHHQTEFIGPTPYVTTEIVCGRNEYVLCHYYYSHICVGFSAHPLHFIASCVSTVDKASLSLAHSDTHTRRTNIVNSRPHKAYATQCVIYTAR